MQVGELLVKLGVDWSAYQKDLKRAEAEAQRSGSVIGQIFRNAFSFALGMGFFEAIKRGFKSIIGEAIDFNSTMEQAQIGFTTMLKSAEDAQAFLREMMNFAARTPFEFPDLLEASRRMMAYGFAANDVLPMLQAVGDATAALGLGAEGIDRIILALGQMRAKGKVTGEEMRQLTEAGIPAWEILAEAMGKSTAEVMKLASKGFIPAGEAIQALVEGLDKRFGGMMQRMENTWAGITSTLKDVWRMTVGSITVELFKGVTGWLQRLRDMATTFYQVFSTLRQRGIDTANALRYAITYAFGENVGTVANVIITTVQRIWQAFVRAAVIIRTYWESIRFVLTGVLTTLFVFKVVLPIFNTFIKLVGILNGSLTVTSGLFGLLSKAVAIYRAQLITADVMGTVAITRFMQMRMAVSALIQAFGALRLAILGVAALILGPLVWAWSKYAEHVQKTNMARLNAQLQASIGGLDKSLGNLPNTATQAGKGLSDLGKNTAKASKKAKGSLAPFDELHQIMTSTADSAEDAGASIGDITMPAVGVGGFSGGALDFSIPSLDFKEEKMSIKGFLKWAWDSIRKWKIWKWLADAWDWLVKQGKKAWELLKQYIWQPMVDVWNWLVELWNKLSPWLQDKWDSLVEAAKTAWGWIKEHIIKPISDAWAWLVEIWNKAVAWLGERWNRIVELAKTAWNWVKEHIINPLKNAWDWLLQAWNSITTWLSQKWNDIATTAKVAWEWVKQHIINPIKNTWDWLVQVWNSITSWLSSKWNEIVNTARTVWGWIKDNIIRPIQDAWNWLVSVWNSITGWLSSKWNDIANTARTVWDWVYNNIVNPVKRAWDWLISTWNSIKAKLGEIWNSISSKASSIWKGIGNTIIRFINGAIDAINGMIRGLNKIKISFPSWVPLLGGKTLGFNLQTIGHIPYLAEGGIVTSPTLAMIGEAGAEAVIPLERDSAVLNKLVNRIMERLDALSLGSGDVIIQIGGEEVGRIAMEQIKKAQRQAGKTLIPV